MAIASCDCLLPVLPPARATNFHVAESKHCFYFLQHENLLRAEVVIRAATNVSGKCTFFLCFQEFRKPERDMTVAVSINRLVESVKDKLGDLFFALLHSS